MSIVIEFLKGTPTWVYIIFVYFLIQGIKALKPKVMRVEKIFILPLVFTLLSGWASESRLLIPGALAAVIGGVIGWMWMQKVPFRVDKTLRTVHLPGSPFALILFLAIFIANYTLGAMQAVAPETFAKIALYSLIPSGFMVGLSWGRALWVWKVFNR